MALFKQESDGVFVPFEQEPFPDLERKLEDWIEANPHMLLEDEPLAVVARQPRTQFAKFLDLLAVDRTGATVVVELKRGEAPREVVAQALEYASWIDSLSSEQLDEVAREYATRKAIPAESITDLYRRAFADDDFGEGESQSSIVTFNSRQRIVIVAEHFSGEVEQTLRYMRTRLGADVYAVRFTVHRAGDSLILHTETVVGREIARPTLAAAAKRGRESDESMRQRATTEFMRNVVGHLDGWVRSQGMEGLTFEPATESESRVRMQGRELLYYYHARAWLYCFLRRPHSEHVQSLQGRLSKPDSLVEQPKYDGWRFHVATWDDMRLLEEVLLERARGKFGEPAAQNLSRAEEAVPA
ncbi:MAG: hypothetical protein WD472_07900 [Dehalococcoidia bacterium]